MPPERALGRAGDPDADLAVVRLELDGARAQLKDSMRETALVTPLSRRVQRMRPSGSQAIPKPVQPPTDDFSGTIAMTVLSRPTHLLATSLLAGALLAGTTRR